MPKPYPKEFCQDVVRVARTRRDNVCALAARCGDAATDGIVEAHQALSE